MTSNEQIVRLAGKNVDLCLLRTDDEACFTYLKWLSDTSFNQWLHQSQSVLSFASEKAWAEEAGHDATNPQFNIVLKDGTLVGNCSIEIIDRNGLLGIVIGEECGRDHGIGTEVMKMLVRFSFEELGLHRVCLDVMADNERARACYEKAGLRVCGIEHEVIWYGGRWRDDIRMELLYDQWVEAQQNTE